MPELIAKSALEGHAALTLGGVTLAEIAVGPITSIAVLAGQAKAVAKGLKPVGLAMPAPNGFAQKAGARIVWTGRDQAFLIGAEPPALEGAAVTDQSDGWAVLALSGVTAVDVLARLGERVRLVDHLRHLDVICEVCHPVFHDPEGEKLRA